MPTQVVENYEFMQPSSSESVEEENDNLVHSLPGPGTNSVNKITYLLKISDPTLGKQKCHCFVSAKVDQMAYGVSFIGYKVSEKSSKDIKSEQDALEVINQGSNEIYSMVYPWANVISIRNVSYRRK